MQNEEDRRQLMDRYGGEESGPLVAVLKCVAGIVAMICVAAAPWLLLGPDSVMTAVEPPASKVVKTFPNALAESRRIFEERRLRYKERMQRATPTKEGGIAEARAAENPDDK